jgi:hypothetical protein
MKTKQKAKPVLIYLSERTAKESKVAAIYLKMSRSKYIEEAILDRLEKDLIKVQQFKD